MGDFGYEGSVDEEVMMDRDEAEGRAAGKGEGDAASGEHSSARAETEAGIGGHTQAGAGAGLAGGVTVPATEQAAPGEEPAEGEGPEVRERQSEPAHPQEKTPPN